MQPLPTPIVPTPPRAARAPFGTLADGRPVEAITLAAGALAMRVLTYGGIIQALEVPDRAGVVADVALGYDTLDGYEADPRYLGALVGRYANRIAGGRFALDGREYRLAVNDPPNHLHGGPGGFHTAVWGAEPFTDGASAGVVLTHASADGDEGYPGAVAVRVTYTLTGDGALRVDYHATADAATPINLTQHAYVNLAGHDAGSILGHELRLAASRYTPVDATLIPEGAPQPVAGTPFDFTTATPIGRRIDADDVQLRRGQGYDHNFVLDRPADGAVDGGGDAGAPPLALAARLVEPRSGRAMEVHTTEPGVQFYSGNVLAPGPTGKGAHAYGARHGLALETQHFPDSPNRPDFPSTVLRPGATYASRTEYRFGVA